MLRVFIGYDSKEPVAYHVLAHSILQRASIPVSITPLSLQSLQRIYTRTRGPLESTEFSMTRFLVPHLSDYKGWSLFTDCDMLCQADVLELLLYTQAFPSTAVLCCQHDYTPQEGTKFLGNVQTAYPRKNWSSLMLFNNARCTALTPDYVNTASGLDLHRFNWLPSETTYRWPEAVGAEPIGALPLAWNWLVGEYADNPDAKILHYTLGGPWFPETRDCPHADRWLAEYSSLLIKESDATPRRPLSSTGALTA